MRHLVGFVLLSLGACGAGIAACPPMPTSADWASVSEEEIDEALLQYSTARLLRCGWEDAEPAFRMVFERERQSPSQDAESESLFTLLQMSPRANVTAAMRTAPESSIPAIRDLTLDALDADAAVQRFESALPRLVDLARRELRLSNDFDVLLDVGLIAQEVRTGQLQVARDHLARVERDQNRVERPAPGQEPSEAKEWLADLRDTLDPQSKPPDSAHAVEWVLDRSNRRAFRCGLAFGGDVFDRDVLRASAQAANNDPDAAIATLLQSDWRYQVAGRANHTDEVLRLLHTRYSSDELVATLAGAEASIEVNPDSAHLVWFGQLLPLPIAIRDDDPLGGDFGTYREHRIDRDEALSLLRGTPLYRVLAAPATP